MLQPFVSASPEFAAYLNAGIPAGRLGKPADVAGAAVWLASGRESGYVTGVVLPVDGGFTAR
jgi:NAD(P)-dependent dehydrogenase (short-subunit alcohol dehydrogenase family)